MNQVRPLLAVVAAALTLAACKGTGSITDPAFRNDKAAPAAQTGSGFYADNGGVGGSGYNLVQCEIGGSGAGSNCAGTANTGAAGSGYEITPCENTGTLGSGYDASTGCLHSDNTGSAGSGYNMGACTPEGCLQLSRAAAPGLSASPVRPVSGAPHTSLKKAQPVGRSADCTSTDNTGSAGSGYRSCP